MSDGATDMYHEMKTRPIERASIDDATPAEWDAAAAKVTATQVHIGNVCDNLKRMLIEKNRKYGDSALNPIRVFAKSDTVEQLRVRIDDKLNRLRNQQIDEDEDVVDDLLGYLVLYKIAVGRK